MSGFLTETHLRHAYPEAGRGGVSRDILAAAVLDVAFDVFLYTLAQSDVLTECDLTFKGGTALRKFFIGHRGRFSFDLDFATPEGPETVAALIAEALADGDGFGTFGFAVSERRGHYSIDVTTPLMPAERWTVKVDFSDRPLALAAQDMPLLRTPLHDIYPFATNFAVPVIALDENIAEKLSRWRDRPLVRDLSDLATLAGSVGSTEDVAAMYVLKSYIGWADAAPNRRPPMPVAPLCETLATLDVAALDVADLLVPTAVKAEDKGRLVERWVQRVHSLFRAVDASARTTALRKFTEDRTGRLAHRAQRSLAALGASPAQRGNLPGTPRAKLLTADSG